MQTMHFVTVGLLLLLAVGSAPLVWGLEGAMIAPVMRSAMWAYLGNSAYAPRLAANLDYFTRLNCGGKSSTDADFEQKCGPCGDAADSNRPNEYGGIYAIGEVVAQYHEGHQINVSVDIRRTNPGGAFRFSLCVTDNTTAVSHSCFKKHVLRWQNTQITQIPVPGQVGLATYTLQLPTGVTCQNCVIQWHWRDDTSTCDPPGSNNCEQPTVTNCADVQILSADTPFTVDFDKPRYDAYASIFDTMEADDNHAVGIHIPRSSLDPPLAINSPDTSPGGSVPIIQPGGVPITAPAPGGALPVIITGGGQSINPSPGTSLANSTNDVADDPPPDTSETLLDPVGVVLPAVVGTTSVLSGNTGLGLALIAIAVYMYLTQTPLIQGNSVFGTQPPPSFLPTPYAYQSYLNPSFQQNVVPSGSVYNSGVFPYTQTVNGGLFQGQSGFGGAPYPYLQNSYVASGGFNLAIGPNVAPGVFNPAIGSLPQTSLVSSGTAVLQQPFMNTNSMPFSSSIATGNPGIINTGFTSFQAPIHGGVSTGLSSGNVFTSPSLAGNGFVAARPNIPITNNAFTQQFPQGNNAFVAIPRQQAFINGNTQIQGSFRTQTPFQTPFRTRQDIVMPQFDQEPSTIRQRETRLNQGEINKDEKSCECNAHLFLLTAYCHALSATECQEDDECFCNANKRRLPANFNRRKRPLSSINTQQGQIIKSPIQPRRFTRRRPSMRYNKQK